MSEETKSDEILEAVHAFADYTEKEFNSLKNDNKEMKSDIVEMKSDISTLRNQMVTKDYLDEKLADQRGDLILLTRKEDKKVMALVDVLKQRKLIDDADVKKIMGMEPFPQTL